MRAVNFLVVFLSVIITGALAQQAAAAVIDAPPAEPQQSEGGHTADEEARFNYARGIALVRQGKTADARLAFEKSLSFQPHHVDALLGLAEMLFQLDDVEAAGKHIETAFSVAPSNPDVLISLARLRLTQGKPGDSETALLKAIKIAPDMFRAHIDLADLYSVVVKQPQKALTHYQRATTIDPEHAGAQYGLGMSLRQTGDAAGAWAAFAKASELDQVNPLSLQALAELALAEGQADAALDYFAQAKERDASYAPPYYTLAEVYMADGKPDQALGELDALLKQNSGLAEAYLRRALIQDSIGKKKAARADYAKAIALNITKPLAYNNLAWLLATGSGEFEKAIELSYKAVELSPRGSPEGAQFLDTLGWIYHLNNQPQRARGELEKARDLAPDDPVILYHLAVVYKELGNASAATKLFNTVLEMKPDAALAAEIRIALDNK